MYSTMVFGVNCDKGWWKTAFVDSSATDHKHLSIKLLYKWYMLY